MNARSLFCAAAMLVAPALTTGPALAASHDRDTFIREQDLNGDGRVSKEEFQTGRSQEFARMDANHDGVLSEAEYVGDYQVRLEKTLPSLPERDQEEERVRQMRQAHVRFGVLDSDRSGAISSAEFAYSGWTMFIHHDTNKDGFVSKDDPIAKDDA